MKHPEQRASTAVLDAPRSFADLGLIAPILRAVQESGYAEPTPIQTQAIPLLLEGRDLLGCARTGTGKTAAFALPILQRLAETRAPARHEPTRHDSRRHDSGRHDSHRHSPDRREPNRHPSDRHAPRTPPSMRVLVLVPTRELASQVAESFKTYGRHLRVSVAVVYGGVGQQPQVHALARGADVVVATPGRLVDLMGQGHANLSQVEMLVLDEADRMLDLGFVHDVRRVIAALPKQRQTLFFSATMPPPIAALAHGILVHPAKVMVTPAASTVELVEQWVKHVPRQQKPTTLARMLRERQVGRALVFTRTKHGANRLARWLVGAGITADAIHGNKSQGARERTLTAFRAGRVRVLVATDVAARGIDVDDVTHVFNFDLPNDPHTYVHRIGRTARAGASGVAISLCDPEERAYLRDVEKLIRRTLRAA